MQEITFSRQNDGYNMEQVNSYISLLQEEYEKLFEHCNELSTKIGELNLKLARNEVQNQATFDGLKNENTMLQQRIDDLVLAAEALNVQTKDEIVKEAEKKDETDKTEKEQKPIAISEISSRNDEILLKTVAALTGIVEKLINDNR